MPRNPEDSIRSSAWSKKLGFSSHAMDRMGERMITIDQVYDCILYGTNIETQYHGRDVKVVFQQAIAGIPSYYAVVADNYPFPEVVTVCSTMDEVWEFIGGILIRRTSK